MRRALGLARRGWGRVHPNPLVGAVLVRDNRVVGQGYHAEFGGPHAEIVALQSAQGRALGASLYVTLEPCSHHGKTPPCTDAILGAGVSRVVFAEPDSHREAAGGAGILAAHGVAVMSGVLAADAHRLNAAFHHAQQTASPYVALKLAMSLDQRLSETPDKPARITGPAARAEVHRLRAGFDAILTGVGTVAADDPALTVRGDIAPRVPPIRVVLDSEARTPLNSKLLQTVGIAPVWIISAADSEPPRRAALEAAGARVLKVKRGSAGLDLGEVWSLLWCEGVRSVFCECGSRLAASLLSAGSVQRLYLFISARMLGPKGPPAFAPGALEGWAVREARTVGDDAVLVLEQSTGQS
jgi:diaminohydroxyphosphoribosylaminopyrimidine deaminase/5-amino-6-(5-phosphoribosylamino)uracil reductase